MSFVKHKSSVDMDNVIFHLPTVLLQIVYLYSKTFEGREILRWGPNGKGERDFNPMGPCLFCGSNDTLYVADSWNDRIQLFDFRGQFLGKFGTAGSGNGEFYMPTSLTVDEDGMIYVADCKNHRIQVFRSDHTYVRQWGRKGTLKGQFDSPMKIALRHSTLYITDFNNNRVQLFNTQGSVLTTWGDQGATPCQFLQTFDLEFDDEDRCYVTEYTGHYPPFSRIQVFETGKHMGEYEVDCTHSCMARGPDGLLYASNKSGVSVIQYTLQEGFDCVSRFPTNTHGHPALGMSFDREGRLFIAYRSSISVWS
jgi:sugar lactone lactonase YvrE